jgi:hypothetical protein
MLPLTNQPVYQQRLGWRWLHAGSLAICDPSPLPLRFRSAAGMIGVRDPSI